MPVLQLAPRPVAVLWLVVLRLVLRPALRQVLRQVPLPPAALPRPSRPPSPPPWCGGTPRQFQQSTETWERATDRRNDVRR